MIGYFEKVSLEQFTNDMLNQMRLSNCGKTAIEKKKEAIKTIWKNIKLPTRATDGSAGYDFHIPLETPVLLHEHVEETILTGVRWLGCDENVVLMLYPRSSLGFKYGMRFLNTTGVIDKDYYGASNEGHIMAKVIVDKTCCLQPNDRFMQGIFVPYFVTDDDYIVEKGIRTGGMGSTGR